MVSINRMWGIIDVALSLLSRIITFSRVLAAYPMFPFFLESGM